MGGDYYDFLDFGPGQIGVALADVSGKGLYASLLMANLQASLRSLKRQLAADLPGALQAVDRSFGESTAGNHYATLFLGHYDDRTRRFRYASCGHHPPFLLRGDGAVERLPVTADAIGMFEPWACDARELVIGPGDLLVVFSDGVTEALDASGQEFGETGLLGRRSLLPGEGQQPWTSLDRRFPCTVSYYGEESISVKVCLPGKSLVDANAVRCRGNKRSHLPRSALPTWECRFEDCISLAAAALKAADPIKRRLGGGF